MAMVPEQKLFYNIAAVGGYFGGYASVRSLVLGSAQTSNLISLVELLIGANWIGVLIRIGAAILYATGVGLTVVVRNHRPEDLKVYSALIDLIGAGLFLMLPTELDAILALYPIFFCMSFQWNAFPGACGYVSSSVFSTNNFRQVVLGLTDAHYHPKGEGKRKAAFFAGTLLFFHLGVAVAVVGIRLFGLHSTWICMLIILPALYQALRERHSILRAAAVADSGTMAATDALTAAKTAPDQTVSDADLAIAMAEEAVVAVADAVRLEATDAVAEAKVEAADRSEQA